VLLGAKGEGIHVDAGIGGTGMRLERLDLVEVGTLTLREAILTVKLELGNNHGVKTPAMHVEGSLSKHERSSVRHGGRDGGVGGCDITISTVGEKTRSIDHLTILGIGRKGRDGVGESINRVGVVEGLGTHGPEKRGIVLERGAVIHVGIGLDNPHKLLTGVVEVELDLVRGGTNRLVAGELELLDQVLVGVLSHSAALVRVEEHVIDVEGRGNKRLGIRGLRLLVGANADGGDGGVDSPEALVDGTNIKVDLHLVVLKGDQRKGKSGAATEPELKRDVESGLGKSLARSTHLGRGIGSTAGTINLGEEGVSGIHKLCGVTNHLVVTTGLLGTQRKLSPDVHPVAVLAIDALTADLKLHLGDELMTGEIKPAGMSGESRADLRESDLKVGAVGKIAVAADRACDTATEIGLSVECLLDRFHREISVSTVSNLPESNLRITRKVNVLCAIGNELH